MEYSKTFGKSSQKTTIFLAFLIATSWSYAFSKKDFNREFEKALRGKKPIILDFYGIWCPPCNELEETVFSTPQFAELTKKFTFIKVDADSAKSWKLKDRYRVGGYPTVIFTDPKGEELYRFAGYRPPLEFFRLAKLAEASLGKPRTKVCESKNVDDLWRCGLLCSSRKETECATAAFAQVEKLASPKDFEYWDARAYLVESSSTNDLKRDGYERLLREASDVGYAPFWALDYWSLCEETKATPKTELVEKVLTEWPKALSDSRRATWGLTETDLLQAKAQLLEKLGKDSEAKVVWKEAAVALQAVRDGLPKGKPNRGFNLEIAYCLESAGETEEALSMAKKLIQEFPKEFTFYYLAAGMQKRSKKYSDALPLAEKAFELSYGDNRLRAAALLINLYETIPNKGAAKKVYEATKKDVQPSKDLQVRTHRYLENLEEAWTKIQKL